MEWLFLLCFAAVLYIHYRTDRYYLGNESQNLLDKFRLPRKKRFSSTRFLTERDARAWSDDVTSSCLSRPTRAPLPRPGSDGDSSGL